MSFKRYHYSYIFKFWIYIFFLNISHWTVAVNRILKKKIRFKIYTAIVVNSRIGGERFRKFEEYSVDLNSHWYTYMIPQILYIYPHEFKCNAVTPKKYIYYMYISHTIGVFLALGKHTAVAPGNARYSGDTQ